MNRVVTAGLLLLFCCSLSSQAQAPNPYRPEYVWVRIDTVDYRSAGTVREMRGKVIESPGEIQGVRKIEEEPLLQIQLHSGDCNWYLPANIFYTRDDSLRVKTVYKVLYDFSNKPPKGRIAIISSGI